MSFGRIESAFRSKRERGEKLFVPFITAGATPDWLDHLHALVDAGADAIEVGVPFSDPMMDGPVIQAASTQALHRGTTLASIASDLKAYDANVPLVAMTAYNLAFRAGDDRFASILGDAGFSGAILPDLQLDEAGSWTATAERHEIENIMLAATTADDGRLTRIAAAARGWVYGVGTLGVTGERQTLAATASAIARRLKAVTDRPVLVGIGVSTADQAVEVASLCDGVIVGTAIVRRTLDGQSPADVGAFATTLRKAIDSVS